MADDLGSRTVLELKAMLKEQKLPVSGNKQELINRLQENQSSASTSTSTQTPTFNLKDIDWKNNNIQSIIAAIILLIIIPIALSSNSWAYAVKEESEFGQTYELTIDIGLSEVEMAVSFNGEVVDSEVEEFDKCASESDVCNTFSQAGSITYTLYIITLICIIVLLSASIIQMTNATKKVEQLKWFSPYEEKTISFSKMISASFLLFATLWYPLKIFLDSDDDLFADFDSDGLAGMWWFMIFVSFAWFWFAFGKMIRERFIPVILTTSKGLEQKIKKFKQKKIGK